jgi:RHS repeat-associated protein
LGTPRQVINASKQLRWQWDNTEPFGANVANQNPANLGVFAYNLRFPGQYFDAETGLHYNMFRDYNPSTGRYIESDPIGLKGGINTYGYVGGNPLRFVDPTGQVAQCALIPGCVPAVIRLCYTAYKAIAFAIAAGYIVETYDCEENNSCKKDDTSSPPAPPPPLPKKDSCFEPNSPYYLKQDGRYIGIILYKDIPQGAWAHVYPVPTPTGICGEVNTDTMHVTGGGISDISGISGRK